MKSIAALTMVRNDEFFLRKWVDYYGSQLGEENLYVLFDGLDQKVPDFCKNVNVRVFPHVEGNVRQGDKGRISLLSAEAAILFATYDMVIGTDVDEFLIVDPARKLGLAEFLSQHKTSLSCISGLGIDVGQKIGEEGVIETARPFLAQRRYAALSTRYSKTSVLLRPMAWGSGFHRTRHHNFHIVKDLYLFHFGSLDLGRIKLKMGDSELVASGWSRHLKKRARTVYLVSKRPALNWERMVSIARHVQNIVRPPYAWNKPAMFGIRPVVSIPERFRNIV